MSLDVVNCLVNVFLMSKIATVCESKDFEILLIFIIDITTQISDFSINDNSLMLNLIWQFEVFGPFWDRLERLFIRILRVSFGGFGFSNRTNGHFSLFGFRLNWLGRQEEVERDTEPLQT